VGSWRGGRVKLVSAKKVAEGLRAIQCGFHIRNKILHGGGVRRIARIKCIGTCNCSAKERGLFEEE